jgi:hypothetical protein
MGSHSLHRLLTSLIDLQQLTTATRLIKWACAGGSEYHLMSVKWYLHPSGKCLVTTTEDTWWLFLDGRFASFCAVWSREYYEWHRDKTKLRVNATISSFSATSLIGELLSYALCSVFRPPIEWGTGFCRHCETNMKDSIPECDFCASLITNHTTQTLLFEGPRWTFLVWWTDSWRGGNCWTNFGVSDFAFQTVQWPDFSRGFGDERSTCLNLKHFIKTSSKS